MSYHMIFYYMYQLVCIVYHYLCKINFHACYQEFSITFKREGFRFRMKIVHVHWPRVSSSEGLFLATNGALRLQGKYQIRRPGM